MSRAVVQFSVMIALVLSVSEIGRAQNACTVPGIAGKYVGKCNGYLTPGTGAPMLPATLLFTAVGEKDGNWSGTGVLFIFAAFRNSPPYTTSVNLQMAPTGRKTAAVLQPRVLMFSHSESLLLLEAAS
jgi:hypothetical protein